MIILAVSFSQLDINIYYKFNLAGNLQVNLTAWSPKVIEYRIQ